MKKINFIGILLIVFFINFNIKSVAAYETETIKIGLTQFSNVENFKINNDSIEIGYDENGKFLKQQTLNSNDQFLLKITDSIYVKLIDEFTSYTDALDYINNNKNFENMYPALIEDGKWGIYSLGFSNKSDAQVFLTNYQIKGNIIETDSPMLVIYSDNKPLMLFDVKNKKLQIKNAKINENINLNGNLYRNIIEVSVNYKKLSLINVLDIEEYLYGVVPVEIPSSWHKEALKAQAVAARNYAHKNKGIHKSNGYDLCDTTHCQVYGGVSKENINTTNAVDETKGVFAYYNGQPINAFYYSSNGGYSDNSENVWSEKVDYLRAVKDDNETGYKVWSRTFKFEDFNNFTKNIGNVKKVILVSDSQTKRALNLIFVGENGIKNLEKEEIRTFFSQSFGGTLESRNFLISNVEPIEIERKNNEYLQNSLENVNNKINVVDSLKQISYVYLEQAKTIDKNKNINNFSTSEVSAINKDKDITTYKKYNPNEHILVSIVEDDLKEVTFSGKGWGHAVGMSQYGANSLANKGYSFDEILKYYYSGIEVK